MFFSLFLFLKTCLNSIAGCCNKAASPSNASFVLTQLRSVRTYSLDGSFLSSSFTTFSSVGGVTFGPLDEVLAGVVSGVRGSLRSELSIVYDAGVNFVPVSVLWSPLTDVYLVAAASGAIVAVTDGGVSTPFASGVAAPRHMALSPDQSVLFVIADGSPNVLRFDVRSKAPLAAFAIAGVANNYVNALVFHPRVSDLLVVSVSEPMFCNYRSLCEPFLVFVNATNGQVLRKIGNPEIISAWSQKQPVEAFFTNFTALTGAYGNKLVFFSLYIYVIGVFVHVFAETLGSDPRRLDGASAMMIVDNELYLAAGAVDAQGSFVQVNCCSLYIHKNKILILFLMCFSLMHVASFITFYVASVADDCFKQCGRSYSI